MCFNTHFPKGGACKRDKRRNIEVKNNIHLTLPFLLSGKFVDRHIAVRTHRCRKFCIMWSPKRTTSILGRHTAAENLRSCYSCWISLLVRQDYFIEMCSLAWPHSAVAVSPVISQHRLQVPFQFLCEFSAGPSASALEFHTRDHGLHCDVYGHYFGS